MDRAELIDRLVTRGHLSLPDRRALGLLCRNEVFNAVRARLSHDGYFPPNARAEGCVYEGPQVHRSEDGRYAGISQRASVFDFLAVAEATKCRFENIDAAVNWYIDSEWGAGVDGIPFT
jgi:hypothetical protein